MKPPPTSGLRHVALHARRFEATLAFYRDLLGMRVEWRPDADNAYLTSGVDNLAIHRTEGPVAAAGQRLDHIGFVLETAADVDRWHDYLAAHGVALDAPPRTHRDGARSFYCKDPEGATVQFIHHPPLAGTVRAAPGDAAAGDKVRPIRSDREGKAVAQTAIEEGKAAPLFTLPDADGNKVALKDLRGRHVVVYFYPRDDTPGCTKEACGFRDLWGAVKDAGAAVLGISPDSEASHRKFRDKYALPFTLLSDPERKVMARYGAFGEKTMYGRKTQGVIRSTVLIGPDGKVVKHWRRVVKAADHPQKVLEALQQG